MVGSVHHQCLPRKTVLFGATPTINNDLYPINTRLLKNKVHYLRVNSASPKRGSRVRIRVRYTPKICVYTAVYSRLVLILSVQNDYLLNSPFCCLRMNYC
jgi:hypothetical protein